MKRAFFATGAALLLGGAGLANALPVVAPYVELPPCDAHVATLNHELGTNPLVFGLPGVPGLLPPSELIEAAAAPIQLTPTCSADVVPAGLLVLDWSVTITNLTGVSWTNLFFVADTLTITGAPILYNNFDGSINGGLAFRIDNVGVNTPLVAEIAAPLTGATPNLIFEPLETWVFTVLDWDPIANGGLALAPFFFTSAGVGALSSDPVSNASIVATLVPEPGSLLLLGLGLLGLGYARRKTA